VHHTLSPAKRISTTAILLFFYFRYKSVSSIYATGLITSQKKFLNTLNESHNFFIKRTQVTAAAKTLMTEEVLFQIQDKFLIKYENVINFCGPVQ
jgi:hypothetical protein